MFTRVSGGQTFQSRSQPARSLHLREGETCNERSSARLNLDESYLFEAPKRFAHSSATDLKRRGQLLFHNALAEFKFAVEDRRLNGLHHAILRGLYVDAAHCSHFCGRIHKRDA